MMTTAIPLAMSPPRRAAGFAGGGGEPGSFIEDYARENQTLHPIAPICSAVLLRACLLRNVRPKEL
jgi:hypothetical protein